MGKSEFKVFDKVLCRFRAQGNHVHDAQGIQVFFVPRNLVVEGIKGFFAGGVLDWIHYAYACDFRVHCRDYQVVMRERPLKIGLRGDVIKAESLASPLGAMLLNEGFQFRKKH